MRLEGFALLRGRENHQSPASTLVAFGEFRVNVDGDQAQRCLDDLRTARDSCDINDFRDADCDAAVIGTVEPGDTCIFDSECNDGYCRIDYDSDGEPEDLDPELGVGEGRCVARAGNGDECSGDAECEEGLYCSDDDTCARLPGEGDRCGSQCREGLSCEFDPVADDEICVPSDDDDDDDDDDLRNVCTG